MESLIYQIFSILQQVRAVRRWSFVVGCGAWWYLEADIGSESQSLRTRLAAIRSLRQAQ